MKSIADYDKEIGKNPKNAELYRLRAEEYSRKDDYEKAIADYTKALQLEPNCHKTYYSRGMSYYYRGFANNDNGDFDQAISDFSKSIQIKPDAAGVYVTRGMAYELKEDTVKALSDYETAIQVNPKNPDGYFNRGRLYSIAGSNYIYGNDIENGYEFIDMAITDFDKAISLKPDEAKFLLFRGNCFKDRKNFDKAILDYKDALALNPKYIHVLNARASLYYFSLGNYAQAAADWEAVLKLNPNDATAKKYLEKAKSQM